MHSSICWIGQKRIDMDAYIKRGIKVTLIISMMLGLILMFIQLSFAFGLWLGSVAGLINMLITSSYYADLLFEEEFSVVKYGLFFLIKLGFISGSLYLGIIFPNYVNIFMVALGLIMLKLCLYVTEFYIRRRKE